MGEKKIYKEGFFEVLETDIGYQVRPISMSRYKKLEGKCAEVNIPHHTDDTVYCLVCMFPSKSNATPVILEAVEIQASAAGVVTAFSDHFKVPKWMQEDQEE